MTGLINSAKNWVNSSLKRQLLLFFLIVVVVQILITGLIGYRLIYQHIESILDRRTQELTRSLVQEINYVRGNFENHAAGIMANPRVQEVLHNEFSDNVSLERLLEDQAEIGWLLMDSANRTSSILIGNKNTYKSRASAYAYTSHEEIIESEIFALAQASEGAVLWVTLQENIMSGRAEPSLYLCKAINMTRFDFRTLGHLIMNIPFDILESIFTRSELSNNEYFVVVDSEGYILFHTLDEGLIGKPLDDSLQFVMGYEHEAREVISTDEGSAIIYYSPFMSDAGRTGWNVLYAVPTAVPADYASTIGSLVWGIMLVLLILSIPLVFVLLNSVSGPLVKLKNTVADFGSVLNTRAEINRKDEIGSLQESFNKMADDIEGLLSKEIENNDRLRELELTALEYQVNPHFLYNALDTIYWMARDNDKDKSGENVAEMIRALGEFYRIGFGRNQETYTVKDELGHIRQYLMLNKLRMKDKFEFNITAGEDVLDLPIIKIILQPIVENAIRHGIGRINNNDSPARKGVIDVTVSKDEQHLVFAIKDNGDGISDARLRLINQSITDRNYTQESENGFGLYYISQRLWLHYYDRASIFLENCDASGTIVYVRIPLEG